MKALVYRYWLQARPRLPRLSLALSMFVLGFSVSTLVRQSSFDPRTRTQFDLKNLPNSASLAGRTRTTRSSGYELQDRAPSRAKMPGGTLI